MGDEERELFRESVRAFVEKEVLALLEDPERRARQSRLVREAVRAYDWRSLGDRYLQLVEDVIGERAGLVARH